MNDHINQLITKQLTNSISKEENEELVAWIEESESHRRYYERIINDTQLVHRFNSYKKINNEEAWKYFEKHCLHKGQSTWRGILKYAAVLALPLVGIAIWLLFSQEPAMKPVLSQATKASMIKASHIGKENATLILPNGQNIHLQSNKNMKVQDIASTYMMNLTPASINPTGQNNTLATNKGNEYWLTFEDGTIVHLNYNTTLVYPTKFNSEDRTVYLNGEAYFQVAKDKRPFRVVTSNSIIKEYGTSFNVNTKEQGKTKVVLVEGSISVTPSSGKEYMIKPGELALVQSASKVSISQTDIEPYVAWNSGHFVFDNYTLEQIMNVISLWYNLDVKFTSKDIKQMHYTGSIDKYGSIQPFLNAIKSVTHLNITIKDKEIIIGN